MISILLALAAGVAVPDDSTASFMGPGVSRALAAHRAALVRDVRYDLTLDVTGADTASGTVRVNFERMRAGDVILDFRGLALRRTAVNGRRLAQPEFNGAHLRIPDSLLATGSNSIVLSFASAIAPAGASIIRFHDVTDGADYLYTLLVPADANALFPCFDQPDLKARVTLSLTTRRGWTAVANGSLARREPAGDRVTHHFRQTRPMSTYLIAFAAGPWATVSGDVGGRTLTMYARASRLREAEADSLLRLNGQALEWLARYFDRPYPFEKYDFVLAPAFPFGGMEHPGAVFYNEETFIYRERPTLTQRLGRTATIYHEVAHQWFGDLVTMRWFDDLWLKEGFATYMAAKMQNALDPRAGAWKTFYLRNKPLAYAVDASQGTTPVWQELANLDQAKSNYGAIVYNKAPSVLKQLDYLVGDTLFRNGVRAFLGTHAYANATWRELLSAIGESASRPLDDWGAQYILRPGIPVIEQQLTVRDGRIERLALVQRPARELSGAGAWPVRLELLLAYDGQPAVRIPVELDGDTTVVPAVAGRGGPTYVYANAQDYAYALVMLDERSVAWLEANIGDVRDDFLRAMLWGSIWDLVRDARFAPERFVAMTLRELPAERDEQIASALLTRLTRAVGAYLSPAAGDSLLPSVERTLAAVADDTARAYGLRKSHLDALIANASSDSALGRLDALLDGDQAAGAPLRPPTRWAIVTTLIENQAPSAERRLRDETRRDSTTEGKRRAFVAGAARPSAEVKASYFSRYFHDATLNEDWATASLRAFNSPRQATVTLPYLVPALDTLPWIQRNRRIFFLGNWLSAFLEGQTSPEALRQVHRFLTDHPNLPRDLRLKILQAADELERTVRIRGGSGAVTREM
ncbi:MAG TPA: M1 family aminopeptidase [Gemmatimonadaceae bacterium]|nr:M1 family aminopeptidase [Gemmatimonadaceae bacterium]